VGLSLAAMEQRAAKSGIAHMCMSPTGASGALEEYHMNQMTWTATVAVKKPGNSNFGWTRSLTCIKYVNSINDTDQPAQHVCDRSDRHLRALLVAGRQASNEVLWR
jgi:hypothetical protein